MGNNLVIEQGFKYCNVSFSDEYMELKFNFEINDDLFVFIVMYSYIKFRYFIIEKILLKFIEAEGYSYRNISFIQNFSYIDFKIWWNKIKNNNYSVLDTKIYVGHDVEIGSILIFMNKATIDFCRQKFIRLEDLQPKTPLKNKIVLQEIVGDLDEDVFKILFRNEK